MRAGFKPNYDPKEEAKDRILESLEDHFDNFDEDKNEIMDNYSFDLDVEISWEISD